MSNSISDDDSFCISNLGGVGVRVTPRGGRAFCVASLAAATVGVLSAVTDFVAVTVTEVLEVSVVGAAAAIADEGAVEVRSSPGTWGSSGCD